MTAPAAAAPAPVHGVAQVDRSCRIPITLLLAGAAFWLLLGSCFGLIASIKFHSPDFLAGSAWLTYGRVRPVYVNAVLYGFALQAGLGLALWLIARLGNSALRGAFGVATGGVVLNLGIALGLAGVLAGDSTGLEHLEMPGYAASLILFGYLLVAASGLLTFHHRTRRPLFPSLWFLLAALVWFPWIYCTAELLLVTFPVRGVTQAVIAWWFSQNMVEVWLGLVGLGTAFYFVPALSARPLHSRYLALLAFWLLILFGGCAVVPGSAPVPAWMPALSAAARGIGLALFIAVALNIYRTAGRVSVPRPVNPPLSFVLLAVAAFLVAWLMGIGGIFSDRSQLLHFSWFAPARFHLQVYGFFVMICLGAIYYLLPRLLGLEFPWAKLVRLHFWLAFVGLVLVALPLAAGGVVQARKMAYATTPFVEVARATLPFLRASTVGELLLVAGHVLLLANMGALLARLWRVRLASAYAAATEDLFNPAEAKA